jgi:hypothetical protein
LDKANQKQELKAAVDLDKASQKQELTVEMTVNALVVVRRSKFK